MISQIMERQEAQLSATIPDVNLQNQTSTKFLWAICVVPHVIPDSTKC